MSVTPEMIAVALGKTAPVPGSITDQQWKLWIQDAAMLIETRRQSFASPPELNAAMVDYVVREAVVTHVRKPDDATQVTVAVDDGSTSRTYQSGAGRVAIIDAWWALLGLVEQSTGAYAVDLAGGGGVRHMPWCDLMFGGVTCSCGVALAGRPIYEPGEYS